jgi:hypothetical protein
MPEVVLPMELEGLWVSVVEDTSRSELPEEMRICVDERVVEELLEVSRVVL